ncbi:MAG: hypothetical protein KA267_06175, partial [Gemmatimonadales bacterium]|nr:hypothetical protein [Gemmatimonadales bacterium]
VMDEVGSGPLEALHELLALVPVRADDEEPPVPIEVSLWFPPVVVQEELPLESVAEEAVEADDTDDAELAAADIGDGDD